MPSRIAAWSASMRSIRAPRHSRVTSSAMANGWYDTRPASIYAVSVKISRPISMRRISEVPAPIS